MTVPYICPECGTQVVMSDSGGVWHTILCRECNVEMKYDNENDDVSVEYVGHKKADADYRLSEATEEA